MRVLVRLTINKHMLGTLLLLLFCFCYGSSVLSSLSSSSPSLSLIIDY